MSTDPFPTRAAPKRERIHFRGVKFTLEISDSEHAGHIRILLSCDQPPRGLHGDLYCLHMKPPTPFNCHCASYYERTGKHAEGCPEFTP